MLAVTGPHAAQEVMEHVHQHFRPPHDPFLTWCPVRSARPASLTPRHYAYLKIRVAATTAAPFCIIPRMRGDLVSRPIGDVLNEARALFEGGVKELPVVSQTPHLRRGREVPHRASGTASRS